MTDLLVITDVPRLGKVFATLAVEGGIQLRVSSSLEKGAEELLADKPDIVFVQNHLSGLSAEILLKHLKKQLGRRRTRFVLLTPSGQAPEDSQRIYQGQIDSSLDDAAMLIEIRATLAALLPRGRKVAEPPPLLACTG